MTPKRTFDLVFSLGALLVMGLFIGFIWIILTAYYQKNGFFTQIRVGRNAKLFRIIKFRTMNDNPENTSTLTTATDSRVTKIGRFLRTYKIDEWPQLLNVLRGEMSVVGPRPDVPGFADTLQGDDRVILDVRPGITGPASIFFRKEDELLAKAADPERYNQTVIWPEKIRINKAYVTSYSLWKDVLWIVYTVLPVRFIPYQTLLQYNPSVSVYTSNTIKEQ
ncbi:MAG: Sugar transferases involved in lipopolysaccharide synthesis [Bacteroidetes bacterium HLUCCA01]|nr:MAG: Sugar transferases involved in lipopolysaccharide synthesis [Bacteroidetes bacterium HLUCCA01]